VRLLDDLIDDTLHFIRKDCSEKVPSVDVNLVQSLLNLLESLLVPKFGVKPGDAAADPLITLYFVFAYVWSMGANLSEKSIAAFDRFAREKIAVLVPDFPTDGTVFVCVFCLSFPCTVCS
jgi:dynein heavy chain